MTEFEISINNQNALEELAWEISASEGEFKLILVRCNYVELKTQLAARLQTDCEIPIKFLDLQASESTLFASIKTQLGDEQPTALMVFGLETVRDLDQILAATNQVREEFRNYFHFPVALWINDAVFKKLARLAPDFESWGTTVAFTLSQQQLTNILREKAKQLFNHQLILSEKDCLELQAELMAAKTDLQIESANIDVEITGSLESLLGFVNQSLNQTDTAIQHYQQAITLWQQLNNLVRQGYIYCEITYCYYSKAFRHKDKNHPDWQATKDYLQQCLQSWEKAQRWDLIANSISGLGKILSKLPDWEKLASLVDRVLPIHQFQNQQIELSQDYGFLAEIALAQGEWKKAHTLAQQALSIVADIKIDVNNDPQKILREQSISLYQFILGKASQNLNQPQVAIEKLEAALEIADSEYDPQFYLDILSNLQQLYYQQGNYLKAFEFKQYQRSIEQQYGLRAFVGAGWIKPQRQAKLFRMLDSASLNVTENYENVASEITASGRSLDVERLIERIGRPDYKFIVIHGQSGVGKSSLVSGGLMPTLKHKASGTQDFLPVLMRYYTNWVEELGNVLKRALEEKQVNLTNALDSPQAILEQLKVAGKYNLRPVIIFDQFEEFFFVYPEVKPRRRFFEFVGECLNILPVKVVLSLREDYIHYLLECNSMPSMKIIGNDILSKNVLYQLGNFSVDDTAAIIQRLTARANFILESDLISKIVEDLAGELNSVRPIELQVVGAQLQTDSITTLGKYQTLGENAKEELVKRYLAEVVADCGAENQKAAELILYLLTDEKGTRPLRTRDELERDLQGLAADFATEVLKLDLALNIFVASGLVVLLPENPNDRYQLVHDYLATFIRQQQEPKLKELMVELEEERRQRKQSEAHLQRFLKRALLGSVAAGLVLAVLAGVSVKFAFDAQAQSQRAAISEIDAINNSSEALFSTEQNFDALIESFNAREKLKNVTWAARDTQVKTIATLRQAVYGVKESNTIEGHSSYVSSVAFSPDGQTIASASYDNTVKLWKLDGTPLTTLKGHSSYVNSVAFSPDGKTIASASDDSTVKLWKLDGTPLTTLKGHSSSFNSVAFSPDGKTIASASDDSTVKLWKLDGTPLKTLKGHSSRVSSVAFSPDGKTIASASDDSTVKLWKLDGTPLTTLKGHSSSFNSVAFSPDGKTIASASGDKTVKLWKLDGTPLKTLKGHSSIVYSVAFSPDGKTIASASYDSTVKLWKLDGTLLKTLTGHSSYVYSVAFSPDGKTIASASDDSTVKLWKLDGTPLTTLKGHSSSFNSVAFSPDGKTIASASGDKTVKLWKLDGTPLKTLKGHSSIVYSVAFSPDGKTIASASYDSTVKLWKLDGTLLKTLTGHSSYVYSVAFSPDGKTIASASWDNTVKLWKLDGTPLTTLKGHSSYVNSVAFSPDGKTIASASDDSTVKLWKLDGTPLKTLKGHSSRVSSVAFSPDGKTIASASDDSTVKLWKLDGTPLTTLKGHSSRVSSVAFSPDGKTIASASDDSTVKLWKLDGTPLTTLKGHSSYVSSVAFSPDGKTIASASDDSTVILWNFDFDNLLTRGCNWLQDYLATHPATLAELESCQTPALRAKAAPFLVTEGEEIARTGEINTAIDNFRLAMKWNPSLSFDANQKAQQLYQSQQLVNAGEDLANQGDFQGATAKFQAALKLDSSLDFKPEEKARQIAVPALIKQGGDFVKEKKYKEAIAAYSQAEKLNPKAEGLPESWIGLCLYGSLNNSASSVMFACEKADKLDPKDVEVRAVRGVARALAGNYPGAIEDFEAYIALTDNQQLKLQVQGWVKSLKAGKKPFTKQEIKKLLGS